MSDYFTSDWHLFHKNIIRYCDRPYKNISEMHLDLIKKNNEIVKNNDTLYIIGDMTISGPNQCLKIYNVIKKFNGIKHLIIGNHDEWRNRTYLNCGITTTHSYFWFKYHNYTFHLAHDPAVYEIIQHDKRAILLCGHVHNLFRHLLPDKRVINVGVDVNGYRPVSMNTIMGLLKIYSI